MKALLIGLMAIGAFLAAPMAFIWAVDSDETGTLVVSYQTGSRGERLERIRFRLSSKNGVRQFHPQPDTYVDNPLIPQRLVVIEGLPEGDYLLEFLVPNHDALFETTAPRHVKVIAQQVVRVDHQFTPRYAHLKALALDEKSGVIISDASILLKDSLGHVIAASQVGKLSVEHLTPGCYSLEAMPKDYRQVPSPISLLVLPNSVVGPISLIYTENTGSR